MPMLSLVLAGVLAAGAPKTPTADDYVGPWNVRITDAEDTFVSGAFEITKRDGAFAGGLVWRSGSYGPASSVEVKDGALVLVREEKPGRRDTFEARLEGGVLRGRVTHPDGTVRHFEGRRAPALLSKKAPVWGEPIRLFDGKSLEGWRLRDPKKRSGWAVTGGELAVVEPEGNADLVTERTFQDMKLHVEFNVVPHGNSGVYLRGRYEIQIESDDPSATTPAVRCGALYSRIAPALDATKAAGEWQAYDITLVGRRLTVVLNGTTIVDGVADGITGGALSPFEDEPGPLMLQGDHGRIRFRNIVVTPGR
jgi:hypothetical protein